MGRWRWLFPVTMVVHVAEEARTAETFPRWISRVAGVDLDLGEFLVLNAIALAVITAGAGLARSRPWAAAALAVAVLTNVVLHVGGTVVTGSWSPGLASAALLWLPLGGFTLFRVIPVATHGELTAGIVVGLLAHLGVSLSLVLA